MHDTCTKLTLTQKAACYVLLVFQRIEAAKTLALYMIDVTPESGSRLFDHTAKATSTANPADAALASLSERDYLRPNLLRASQIQLVEPLPMRR